MAISNKMKGSMLAIGAFTAVAIGGTSLASAQSTNESGSLVDKIASRFNLNKDEVKAVFEEEHKERQAEMNAELSTRLQEAVDSGKITSEQKTLIEAKNIEMQASREQERKDLEKWATDNSIELKYLMVGARHNSSSGKLQSAVDSGKITAEQKTLIESKQAELKQNRDSKRSELEAWAKENGIDIKYLHNQAHGHKGNRGDAE